jgi:hypothetical protein
MVITLVANSKSEDEPDTAGGRSGLGRRAGRFIESAVVRESNLGREFVADFVAQTNPGFDVGEARSNFKGRTPLL